MSAIVGFDFGNYGKKLLFSQRGNRYYGLSYVVALSSSDWKGILARNNDAIPEGYIVLGNKPYAVGDTAKRHAPHQPQGADRYVRGYYDVGFVYAVTEALKTANIPELDVITTFAPRDVEVAPRLQKDLILARFQGKSRFGDFDFTPTAHSVSDEPIGGFYDYVLTNEGTVNSTLNLKGLAVGILDIGGLTIDGAAVDGFKVDPSSLLSHAGFGANRAIDGMEKGLRKKFPKEFNSKPLARERLEQAIRTGFWGNGQFALDCQDIAKEQRNALLSAASDLLYEMGGVRQYDVLIGTGGGFALIYDEFIAKFANKIQVEMADDRIENLPFANAIGACKILHAKRVTSSQGVAKVNKGAKNA
jgi:hypothetical protein